MKRLRLIVCSLLFFAGLLPAVAQNNQVVITLPPAVEVEGEELYLGQLADVKANPALREQVDRVYLGRAPRFGETQWLYRTNVIYALDRSELAGFYMLEMPTKVKITRASQRLMPEMIRMAVESYIRDHASPYWTAWEVELSHLQERSIPKGKIEYRFAEKNLQVKPGLLTFRIGVAVNGDDFTTIPVTVRLTIKAPVYVTTSKLNRYADLTADSFCREARELTTGDEWLAELPAGKYRAIRELPAGKVLTGRDLQEKPLVAKGDKLRLILQSGSIQVELSVQAEEDGRLGDRITVTNLSSNRRLTATVLGPGLVEVKLD